MRVAALYDIHGNLPALEAVLDAVRRADVDRIVVGGDVLPGPMPRETLDLLLDVDMPVQFIYGNGERAVLAQMEAHDPSAVTYWGTTSGEPLSEPLQDVLRWTGRRLNAEHERVLRSWPGTVTVALPELGSVLLCHGTPRSETESFTRLTPEEPLRPLYQDLAGALVICGHTHMQFDRVIGGVRVINAGSVGMPFGPPGAYWVLLGDDVELRHTSYDLERAADRVRATQYPQAEEFATHSIVQPPSEEDMLRAFTSISFR